jgi:hypothetical protein
MPRALQQKIWPHYGLVTLGKRAYSDKLAEQGQIISNLFALQSSTFALSFHLCREAFSTDMPWAINNRLTQLT